MKIRLALYSVVFCLLLPLGALGDTLPSALPESIGLSPQRLKVLTDTLKAGIDKGEIPGVVLMISRHGKVGYFEAMGSLDPEKKTPIAKDSIFRIYSMTKPITSCIAMMLFEDGRLALSDPVAKYLPEFKDVKVGEERKDAGGKVTLELVTPARAMTIQDLCATAPGSPTASLAKAQSRRPTVKQTWTTAIQPQPSS